MDFSNCVQTAPLLLMEGALGERLKREYQLRIDGPVGMADLLYSTAGQAALSALWKEYAQIAACYQLPFLATTPTRRCNRERAAASGYTKDILLDNAALLQQVRRELQQQTQLRMYVGGLMGCQGDAYTGAGQLDARQAQRFHCWQAETLAQAGLDFLFAGIMPTLPEALGMARAMADTQLPYIISFTITRAGRLIDGTTISAAIARIDAAVQPQPLCYMSNCVHPRIVLEALQQPFNQTQSVKTRFLGVQANSAELSYALLDQATALHSSPPEELARAMLQLRQNSNCKIFGGCCGTDGRHLQAMAQLLSNPAVTWPQLDYPARSPAHKKRPQP